VKVIFTRSARLGLAAIANHIAVDNPSRALSFTRDLRNKAQTLASYPLAFPVMDRYRKYALRRYPVGRYLIIYRAWPDRIVIYFITHAAQNYLPLLDEVLGVYPPDAH